MHWNSVSTVLMVFLASSLLLLSLAFVVRLLADRVFSLTDRATSHIGNNPECYLVSLLIIILPRYLWQGRFSVLVILVFVGALMFVQPKFFFQHSWYVRWHVLIAAFGSWFNRFRERRRSPRFVKRRLELLGYLLPHKSRKEIWEPSVEELICDWVKARRSYRDPWERWWIDTCFYLRGLVLVADCMRVASTGGAAKMVSRVLQTFVR